MEEEAHAGSVTLRQIAKSLGISHVTVSRALRNSPEISLVRRQQIQEKAVLLGYRPNPMATALGQMRFTSKARAVTAELAWLVHSKDPRFTQRFKEFNLYWKGASETARWFGYNLEEFICNHDFNLQRLEKTLLARGVRGILIPPLQSLPEGWDDFRWENFSAVRFGHSVARPQLHVVTSDQLSNSLLALAKMEAHGYLRIGYASAKVMSTRHKAGVLMAQSNLARERQIEPLLFDSGDNNPENREKLTAWLNKTKPDAILTDVAEVRNMLNSAGRRVPEDIGLAVFSVLDGNADSGIYQNPEEIGKAAIEMLISLINHDHTGVPPICRELLIEGKWVDGTTLPPRSKPNSK
jgi:DNA-binding LacI/PurR family transcriptional regulator